MGNTAPISHIPRFAAFLAKQKQTKTVTPGKFIDTLCECMWCVDVFVCVYICVHHSVTYPVTGTAQ